MSRLDERPAGGTRGPGPDPEITAVVDQLQERLDALPVGLPQRRAFLSVYRRTTGALAQALAQGTFEDPDWVRRWTVTFAGYCLAAHDAEAAGGRPARPWRLAFRADPGLPVLVHLLLGLNAHLNYDLPQAVLAVIPEEDFADPSLMAARRRDHERVDTLLASRVAAEGDELPRSWLTGPLLMPLNRWSTRRFLPAARRQVWANVADLHDARLLGAAAYRARLAELEVLTAARITDLARPGAVLLRLALVGFGVRLPPP